MHSAVTAVAREIQGISHLWHHAFMKRKGQKMVQMNNNKSNMIDCMGKYYLKQMVFLVLYIKEHICVIKKLSLRVDFNVRECRLTANQGKQCL